MDKRASLICRSAHVQFDGRRSERRSKLDAMKMFTAKVVGGQLDVPKGLLAEGTTVMVLVSEDEKAFNLTEDESAFIRESFTQIARGDWIEGEQLLQEIRRA